MLYIRGIGKIIWKWYSFIGLKGVNVAQGKSKVIAIFTGYYLPHLGGVERYVDKLSAALIRRGYRMVIVTSNEAGRASREVSDKRTIYRLPIRNLFKERYPIPRKNSEYRALLREIEDEGIDYFIVNTRFHLTSLVGAKIGKKLNKPVILIEHGTDHFTVNNKVLDVFGKVYEHALTAYLKRFIDRYYGVSKNCNKWLQHFSIQASGVFYNSVSTGDRVVAGDLYENVFPDNAVVVSYAGRLIKEKGVGNLAEAFERVEKKYPQLRLAIAGDGGLYEDLYKRCQSNERIVMLGRLDFPHVMSLYKRSDIFVYPSLYPEGLPTSILEAGLVGTAIIATPRGGTEEVITDSEHGIIVDGSVESLERAIAQLAKDKDYRKLCAKNIQKRVQTYFDWDVVAKEVQEELTELEK